MTNNILGIVAIASGVALLSIAFMERFVKRGLLEGVGLVFGAFLVAVGIVASVGVCAAKNDAPIVQKKDSETYSEILRSDDSGKGVILREYEPEPEPPFDRTAYMLAQAARARQLEFAVRSVCPGADPYLFIEFLKDEKFPLGVSNHELACSRYKLWIIQKNIEN